MSAVDDFLTLREKIAVGPVGDGGPDTCEKLTSALDEAIRELAAPLEGDEVAVVAVGGYGRREQCLWSDVDVMLLHAGGDLDRLTRTVLYPLWDANLKVGHSVRTVAECASAARDRFETLTSLLSGRLVAGTPALWGPYEAMLARLVRGRPLTQQLVSQERGRRELEPYPMMAADVKSGRGGLRTLQGLWWQRRRAELVDLRIPEISQEEERASASLLRVRNGLHASAGRPVDRFVVDLRKPAASWLGTDVHDLAAEMCAALQIGDRLADEQWPDIHAERDPLTRLGRRVIRTIRSSLAGDRERADPGPVGVAAVAAARTTGVRFSAAEVETMQSGAATTWNDAERDALLRLLASGDRGRVAFGVLERHGWVERAFPEWEPVSAAPQLAPFHDHPVGAHLWRTVVEMLELLDDDDPIVAATTADRSADDDLLLAAFLHDIGKGRGGDHSAVGAELAAGFLDRAGFDGATTAVVSAVVLHHLLLSETAMRRDIDDAEVVAEVARRVGNLRTLQLLYLLTIADSRATGATVWTDWKAALVNRLFASVAGLLESGESPAVQPDVDAIVADVAEFPPELVRDHLAAMPGAYVDTVAARDVERHLRAVARLEEAAVIDGSAGDVVVIGRDRTGFLLGVTRVFAANGIGVRGARLWTRADGVAIDLFEVVDDRTEQPITADRWHSVEAALVDTLTGTIDVRQKVRERSQAYRGSSGEVRVRALPSETDRHTVIEVRSPDRVGLLADIMEAFYAEGLDVYLAVLNTRGREASDVFHVRRLGVPIRVAEELEALCGRVRDRINYEGER